MTRIYTRTGDAGETGLFSGARVGKDHPRIEACGDLDELNSLLGAARANLGQDAALAELDGLLARLQHQLFNLGADLATPAEGPRPVPRVGDPAVAALERAIDRLEADLPPLRQFILPGGTPAGALLHLARAVCRRAERRVVALARSEPLGTPPLRYLNRLSDLLFVLARSANHRAGQPEEPWTPQDAPGPGTKPGPA